MIENDFLSNTTKPTLLDTLSQYYVSLDIEKELLSSMTKFTLLDSLRQDSDLSIKAYSVLKEVYINCFKSKYMLVFKKWMGDIFVHELSIQSYSLLQEVCINCFKSKYMLVFYKMDG